MMTTTAPSAAKICLERTLTELCELVGFKNPALLINGGKLAVDDYTVSFIHDDAYVSDKVLVYIDMGPVTNERKEDAYQVLLKMNFDLLAGTRGSVSLHPQTGHIFYSFPFTLSEEATGRNLLDSLIRFIGDIGINALRLPQELQDAQAASAHSARSRAERLIQPKDGE